MKKTQPAAAPQQRITYYNALRTEREQARCLQRPAQAINRNLICDPGAQKGGREAACAGLGLEAAENRTRLFLVRRAEALRGPERSSEQTT
jgi:hypothetical protein